MYEEYSTTSSQEVSDNSAANTLNNDHTSSSSLIVVDQNDAPQIVSSSEDRVDTEPNSPVLNEVADEFVQEDVADFDGNMFHNAPQTPEFDVAESSSTYQDPSNMHQFHQQHRSIDRWTKNHPLEQVIGDPSKPVMTRKRLQTDAEVCMYALTVSTIEPKNIKEAMLDHSWIESMQDELNQFKRLDVWELISRNRLHQLQDLKLEKCVARNALTRKSSVKRALFTSPVAAKSKSLGATSVVAKSRFSVAKTPTATNKVSSVSPLSQKSSQSRILSSYMNNKIATSRKWQKWFEYQQGFSWTPKSKTAKSQSNVHKCRTSVKSKTNTLVIQLVLWIVDSGCSKHMTGNLQLLRNFVEKFMGIVCFGNDHFATITSYRDYVQAPEILWAEAIATACFTQNRSIDDAPPIVSSSEEQIATKSNSPVLNEVAMIHHICINFTNNRSIDKWTKNHPLEQVIGDPSKPVMTRKRLQTDAEVYMYALTELVECPVGRNIIKVKWIRKNKTDAKNTVIRNKSRLVTKGYGQEEGIDFEESFAPVARLLMLSESLCDMRS
ncbi:gag-pol polyprotein [Tanacetum coccineum]